MPRPWNGAPPSSPLNSVTRKKPPRSTFAVNSPLLSIGFGRLHLTWASHTPVICLNSSCSALGLGNSWVEPLAATSTILPTTATNRKVFMATPPHSARSDREHLGSHARLELDWTIAAYSEHKYICPDRSSRGFPAEVRGTQFSWLVRSGRHVGTAAGRASDRRTLRRLATTVNSRATNSTR